MKTLTSSPFFIATLANLIELYDVSASSVEIINSSFIFSLLAISVPFRRVYGANGKGNLADRNYTFTEEPITPRCAKALTAIYTRLSSPVGYVVMVIHRYYRLDSNKLTNLISAVNSPTHKIENMARMASGELSRPLRYNTVQAFGPRDHELI